MDSEGFMEGRTGADAGAFCYLCSSLRLSDSQDAAFIHHLFESGLAWLSDLPDKAYV